MEESKNDPKEHQLTPGLGRNQNIENSGAIESEQENQEKNTDLDLDRNPIKKVEAAGSKDDNKNSPEKNQ